MTIPQIGARQVDAGRNPFSLMNKLAIYVSLFAVGCVHREMNITTNPPGAVVYLNDREIGRTPFKREFLWYGNYDVVVRKDGYQTLKTTADVNPPPWQWVPLDALTDFLPLRDEHDLLFDLKPEVPVDPLKLIARAQAAQSQLQSTARTVNRSVLEVHSATMASTEPATQEVP